MTISHCENGLKVPRQLVWEFCPMSSRDWKPRPFHAHDIVRFGYKANRKVGHRIYM